MSYIVKLTLFACLVLLLIICWNHYLPNTYTSTHAYFILVFFFLFSYFSHLLLNKSLLAENKNEFTYRYMAASGIKLFLSLIVIVIYAFTRKTGVIPFALLFIFQYFLFTGFEVSLLLKQLKSKSSRNKN